MKFSTLRANRGNFPGYAPYCLTGLTVAGVTILLSALPAQHNCKTASAAESALRRKLVAGRAKSVALGDGHLESTGIQSRRSFARSRSYEVEDRSVQTEFNDHVSGQHSPQDEKVDDNERDQNSRDIPDNRGAKNEGAPNERDNGENNKGNNGENNGENNGKNNGEAPKQNNTGVLENAAGIADTGYTDGEIVYIITTLVSIAAIVVGFTCVRNQYVQWSGCLSTAVLIGFMVFYCMKHNNKKRINNKLKGKVVNEWCAKKWGLATAVLGGSITVGVMIDNNRKVISWIPAMAVGVLLVYLLICYTIANNGAKGLRNKHIAFGWISGLFLSGGGAAVAFSVLSKGVDDWVMYGGCGLVSIGVCVIVAWFFKYNSFAKCLRRPCPRFN